MEDWITSALSREQRKPFEKKSQNAVILAAAGSGKTHTLTHLLANELVYGNPASSIIAFTFTEKAANELLARVHHLVRTNIPSVSLDGIFVGTIHAWCLQYLLQQRDFYGFTPIDELQTDAFASRFYDTLGLKEAYSLSFPFGIEKFLKDVEVFYNEHLSLAKIPTNLLHPISTYINLLNSNKLLTFGDMVRSTIIHLQENGAYSQLKTLFVDEYQDVNPAQVELIKSMLPEGSKLVGVGDDLQCIYNWRGSDVTRILRFIEEFPRSKDFRLSDNYRSRPHIVKLGNSIAEDIELRDPEKKMHPIRPNSNDPRVHWISVGSEEEQAETVANIVEKFIQEGVPENKIAILIRSVKNSGSLVIEALKFKVDFISMPNSKQGRRIS